MFADDRHWPVADVPAAGVSLLDVLVRRIAATGPLTIAEYMAEALLHPEHGYYMQGQPFGAEGDFVTAPEISQMFGELVGLCLAQAWIDQGQPAPFALAELGPGRGLLMADVVRATAKVPGFHEAMQVHLVEASPALRKVQADVVPGAVFHDHPADLPDLPLFLVANEFFDALPVRQAIRDGDQWRERVIGLQDDALCFGLTDPMRLAALDGRLGDMIEWHPALPALVSDISETIGRRGGAAVIIDYGDWDHTGDTFQAVRGHKKVSPLSVPGQVDLTAHVNFADIAQAAQCECSGMTPQGVFLERLGITARAQQLAGAGAKGVAEAHKRLTHPDQMGHLFKVIGLVPTGASLPAGLDPAEPTDAQQP